MRGLLTPEERERRGKLAEGLKIFRIRRGLTLRQAATLAGVSNPVWCRWENPLLADTPSRDRIRVIRRIVGGSEREWIEEGANADYTGAARKADREDRVIRYTPDIRV